MKDMILKYKSILAYMFFGVCTTAVNLIIYFLCARVMNFSTIFSTVVAWFIAVIFAFVTNKAWVFESKSWKREIIGKELTSFFACRIATGILDVVVMMVTVDILLMNDVIMKVFSNVLVILINYIASKLIIFRKRDSNEVN